jgi:hypothetical protein
MNLIEEILSMELHSMIDKRQGHLVHKRRFPW